jgi:hypothetical protein
MLFYANLVALHGANPNGSPAAACPPARLLSLLAVTIYGFVLFHILHGRLDGAVHVDHNPLHQKVMTIGPVRLSIPNSP